VVNSSTSLALVFFEDGPGDTQLLLLLGLSRYI